MPGACSPVLVVDDEGLIRWTLSQALADLGYPVREADCGSTALAELQHGPPPTVVLLDYRLPDVNHLDLLSQVRAAAPGARVILMTAFGTADLPDEALACGAYAVVYKPFDLGAVLTLVERASGGRRHQRNARHFAGSPSCAGAPVRSAVAFAPLTS